MESDKLLNLPMDIIETILSKILDPASLVRLASTCKFWRNLIKDEAFLDSLQRRRHSHGLAPSLLLGFFYQDNTESPPLHALQHDEDLDLAPSFMPTSEFIIGSRDSVLSPPVTVDAFMRVGVVGAILNFYEPFASKDGFLALRHNSRASQANLYVCNPLSLYIHDIPTFPGNVEAHKFALLVNEDVTTEGQTCRSFQLVAIYFRRRTRTCDGWTYSSKNTRWERLGPFPALLHGLNMVKSPTAAAASHGAVHFLCGNSMNWTLTHVARLHVATGELSYLELPLAPNCGRGNMLGSSADGGLLLLLLEDLELSLWKHDSKLGSGSGSWVLSETVDLGSLLPPEVVQMRHRSRIVLETFLGRSGAVVLRVEGEEGSFFLFSFAEGSMRKISGDGDEKYCSLCPYEIDWLSCLAITNLVADGSLAHDCERSRIQNIWVALKTAQDM